MAPPPVLQPGNVKPLTSKDIIDFQGERAFRLGELGFTTNFARPEDIFKPQVLNYDSPDFEDPAQDEAAVEDAMQLTHNTLLTLQHQDKLLQIHKPLVARAELEIDRKLLKAGKTKRYVTNTSLRSKVVEAAKMNEPASKPNFVTVRVSTGLLAKVADMLQINLPLQGSLDEASKLLGDIMKAESSSQREDSGEATVAWDEKGIWKYQLVSRDLSKVINKVSVRLETETDYQMMMREITKRGSKTSVAVLVQVSTLPIQTTKAACDKGSKVKNVEGATDTVWDEAWDNVLDDDGKPFFDDKPPWKSRWGKENEKPQESEGPRYDLRRLPTRARG